MKILCILKCSRMDAHRIKPHIYNINHCRQLDFGHDPARTQSWSGQSRSPIGSRPDFNRIAIEFRSNYNPNRAELWSQSRSWLWPPASRLQLRPLVSRSRLRPLVSRPLAAAIRPNSESDQITVGLRSESSPIAVATPGCVATTISIVFRVESDRAGAHWIQWLGYTAHGGRWWRNLTTMPQRWSVIVSRAHSHGRRGMIKCSG